MKRRAGGFTIVELLIVLVVMVILLTLAVVNLRSSEAKAHDHERETDVAAVMTLLETYYTVRSSEATGSGQGKYPPTIAFASETTLKTYLPDITQEMVRAPNVQSADSMSFVPAKSTNAYTTAPSYTGTSSWYLGRATLTTYVYQPLQANGDLCTTTAQTCTRYVIYYTRENGTTNATNGATCTGTSNRYCYLGGKQQ